MGLPRILLALAAASTVAAAEEQFAFDTEALRKMDRAVERAIKAKKLPGGVLWLECRGTVYKRAFGKRSTWPKGEKMSNDTIFDCASLTKVCATTPCVLKLIEAGKINLDDPVRKHLPELKGDPDKANVTIHHLLTHTSGLLAGIRRGYEWSGHADGIALASSELSNGAAGRVYRYSDINFILLGEIVKRVSGKPLDRFATEQVFTPLQMDDTRFRPAAALGKRVAPTTRMPDKTVLRGVVHDPTSRAMGGVAGHAGLFATAADLARYARMILNGGEVGGVRVLRAESVRLMTSVQSPHWITARRGLGWDIDSPYAGPRGKTFPVGSFGHTGWTGTSIWIDPWSQTFVIFLSNRNHPSGGDVRELRYQLSSLAAEASGYDFKGVRGALKKLTKEERTTAKGKLAPPPGKVLNGIDALVANGFAPMKGLEVGLITNHTGRDRHGSPSIDLLHKTKAVSLAALFSPEHGIRGTADRGKITDGIDKKTGLKIHSLYLGKKRKPSAAQLEGLDALVFDIQDIGARFFTYVSTMGLCMEAAEEAGLKFFVLDRVNPIGGSLVEGPVRVGRSEFTAFHDIPVRHGMTVGELARMIRAERYPNLDLTVVELRNWRRSMLFDETGLPWVRPSPNMPNLTAALLYPGIGLLEFTNLSVGRGTTMPFEMVGAPFIDPEEFAKALTAAKLPGLQFIPVRFTPVASKHKDQVCGGVRILVKERAASRPVACGITMARLLRQFYPAEWETEYLNRLLAHPSTAGAIVEGLGPAFIRAEWQRDLEAFEKRREKFLLYK